MILAYLFTTTLLLGYSLSLSQAYVVFPNDDNVSDPYTVTVTNVTSDTISLGSVTLAGPHSSEFNITSDNCSNQDLSAGGSCDISVQFAPKTKGIKNAYLVINGGSSNAVQSRIVFLTNYQSSAQDVQDRLPPTIYDLNISSTLNANSSYNLQWSLIGYDEKYICAIEVFDCSAANQGECGNVSNGPDKLFGTTATLNPDSIEAVDWTYKGQQAHKFTYHYNVTIPASPINGGDWNATGTQAVVRFYVLSAMDAFNNKPSISLIIPGGITNRYYGTSGRKLELTICPEGGCSQ